MAHIELSKDLPGILGPMTSYPKTAKPLNELAERLLVDETPTLSKAERETIASYVSFLNQCVFCSESHSAVADFHWQESGASKKIWLDPDGSDISDRLKALLNIARKVQQDGRSVEKKDVDRAIDLGATENDIHDTVLIAAAFCMYNRYVDGLATLAPPKGDESYLQMGKMLGTKGYIKATSEI